MTMPPQSQRKVDAGRIPGPANVPGVIEVVMTFLLDNGKTATCKLHGKNSGSFVPSVAQANTTYNALAPSWSIRLAQYMHTTTSFQTVKIRDMTDHTLPQFESNVASTPGTGVGAAMPQDVALVLTVNIAARGRGAKGRLYLPGWAVNADAGNGQAIDAVRIAMDGLGQDWLSELTTLGIPGALPQPARQEYRGLTGAVHPARAAGSTSIVSLVCENTEWDTQRRRGLP